MEFASGTPVPPAIEEIIRRDYRTLTVAGSTRIEIEDALNPHTMLAHGRDMELGVQAVFREVASRKAVETTLDAADENPGLLNELKKMCEALRDIILNEIEMKSRVNPVRQAINRLLILVGENLNMLSHTEHNLGVMMAEFEMMVDSISIHIQTLQYEERPVDTKPFFDLLFEIEPMIKQLWSRIMDQHPHLSESESRRMYRSFSSAFQYLGNMRNNRNSYAQGG